MTFAPSCICRGGSEPFERPKDDPLVAVVFNELSSLVFYLHLLSKVSTGVVEYYPYFHYAWFPLNTHNDTSANFPKMGLKEGFDIIVYH